MSHEEPIWTPSPLRVADANLTRFLAFAGARGTGVTDYPGLWSWSVEHPADFWEALFEFCSVVADRGAGPVLLDAERMPGARWFPGTRLNFAENLLRRSGSEPAMVFCDERGTRREVSWDTLGSEVARIADGLRTAGVGPGDRVAGFMPNLPETVIAMLASASIGATWSSCSPDFGLQGVLDRFGQIAPKVLFTADGYFYGGKTLDSLGRAAAVHERIDSIAQVVVVPNQSDRPDISGLPGSTLYADFGRPGARHAFERLPFDHPLYILYSSGTTGTPKCIVHGAGGTLLQHLKEHQLHTDLKSGDRLFYFTTCGWMMWNWLASGLASGATLLLYDGSPAYPTQSVLFDFADAENMTVFGTSAKYIDALNKAGIRPHRTHRLRSLKAMTSTGSPLVPEGFDYVYAHIKKDLLLSSISGGTDIVSCFVLGDPTLPVYRGEIQRRGFGMKVEVFNDEGEPVVGEKGELVCTAPFPSMPVRFWNDPDGERYRGAYFSRFPGIWCHGDYMELTSRGTAIIYGRSDATLNPGGVRIGTAEIYRQVEQLDEVFEGLVIGQEWDNDVRVVLFVRLRDGLQLDEALVAKIRAAIRRNTTPRHVPARVLQVADIPRTKSGKIVELAVRNVVHGVPVKNVEALANPEALEHFRDRSELRT